MCWGFDDDWDDWNNWANWTNVIRTVDTQGNADFFFFDAAATEQTENDVINGYFQSTRGEYYRVIQNAYGQEWVEAYTAREPTIRTISVNITNPFSYEQLSLRTTASYIQISSTGISFNGNNVGSWTYNGQGRLTINLDHVSPAMAMEILQGIHYKANSDNPATSRQLVVTVYESDGSSSTDYVPITVARVNDAPVGMSYGLPNGVGGQPYTITKAQLLAGFSDPDGDSIGVVNVRINGNQLQENPDGSYTFLPYRQGGQFQVIYTVTDYKGGNTTAFANVYAAPGNRPPTGTSTFDAPEGTEDVPYVINKSDLLAGFSDADGDTLSVSTFSVNVPGSTLSETANNTLTIYLPANFSGPFTLSYYLSDTFGGYTQGSIALDIAAVNDAPTQTGPLDLVPAIEDMPYVLQAADLLRHFTDVEGDAFSVTAIDAGTNSTVIDNEDGTFTITPSLNYNGAILNLRAAITDIHGATTYVTFDLPVSARNDDPHLVAPVALQNAIEDEVYTLHVADLLAGYDDVDGDELAITDLTGPAGTTITAAPDGQSYGLRFPANFHGPITLTYTVTDGQGGALEASTELFISPSNDAPTGEPAFDFPDGAEGSSYVINVADLLVGFSDIDGDTLHIADVSTPVAGGTSTLAIDLTDGIDDIDGPLPFTVSVGAFSVAAGPDSPDVPEDVTGAPLVVSGNSVSINNRYFDYLDAGHTATVTFTYTVADAAGGVSLPRTATITVTGANELFNGTAGDDTIFGTNSIDIINGLAGDDVIQAGDGSDVVRGGQGDDRITGGSGDDHLYGDEGQDRLEGGSGNDSLWGGAGRDILIGGSGDDILDGGAGRDELTGGSGVDTFVFSDASHSEAGAGRDVITDFVEDEIIDLSKMGTFTFMGMGSVDRNVDAGYVKYYNYLGNTYIVGRTADANPTTFQIELRGGHVLTTDNFKGLTGVDYAGTNVLEGTAGNDWLYGLGGDDRITGGMGKDTLSGGDGADTFVYASNLESTATAAGHDVIADFVRGQDKIDLSAIDANLLISGKQGFLFSGMGTATLSASPAQLKYFHLNGDTHLVGGVDGDPAADFQVVLKGLHFLTASDFIGLGNSNGADTIVGTDLDDTLAGLDGDDRITGLGGKDTLYGGAGNDTFVYLSASDSKAGIANRDVIADWNAGDKIDLSAIDASSVATGKQSFFLSPENSVSESVPGGVVRSFVMGNSTYVIASADGDNQREFQIEIAGVHNLTASDFIGLGNSNGADTIVGTDLADTIYGLGGDDRITGLFGKDILYGGAGNDTFVYLATTDSRAGIATRDVIADWNTGDKIDLSAIDADSTTAGKQSFVFSADNSVSDVVQNAVVRSFVLGSVTYVIASADGDNQREFQIEIAGVHNLTASDFVL